MAYGERYTLNWDGPTGESGIIYIYEEDYADSSGSEVLRLSRGSLEIRRSLPNWESHIQRTNCSFSIVNNNTDWYDLLPLMTSEESKYRVKVISNPSFPETVFEGFMNTRMVNQPMMNYADLQLTASGFLRKLEYIRIPDIETLQTMSLIDIIDTCLRATGAEYNIRVLCSMYERFHTLSGNQTLFNTTAIYTEVYWETNVDRTNALEVLEGILRTFRCYLYWREDYWYIEQYEDVRWSAATFIEYTTGVSYGYADTAGSAFINRSSNIYDIFSLDQEGGSQSLSVIPGNREVEIKLQQKQFSNLFLNDLTDSADISSGVPEPNLRTWERWADTMSWSNAGMSWLNISNSIYRTGYENPGGVPSVYRGLYTKFAITVGADTSLTIKFKFGCSPAVVGSGFAADPGRWDFTFYYYLRWADSGGPPYDFLIYNGVAEEWQVFSSSSESGIMQTHLVNGSQFDPDLWTYEGDITIPVGDITTFTGGDRTLVFCMGTELVEDTLTTNTDPLNWCYYGDFFAAISEEPDINTIRGDINSGFLNKLNLSLDIFDVGSLNYKNGLLTEADSDVRTISWGDGSDWQPIAEKMLQSIFRLYQISRQKIAMVFKTGTTNMHPLHPFYDSKQSNLPFVMGSDTFYPDKEERHVELLEFDNTSDITLI